MPITLPEPIQPEWDHIHKEVVWLHWRWQMFRDLYAKSPRRIGLLNETAPTFFRTVQDVLLDDAQLALSKLDDPAETGGRRNLTLETLVASVSKEAPDIRVALSELLARFHEKCAGVRLRRNKMIAHFDYNAALKPDLPGASRKEIEEALDALKALMNKIAERFGRTQIEYRAPTPYGGTEAATFFLKLGLWHQDTHKDDPNWHLEFAKWRYFDV